MMTSVLVSPDGVYENEARTDVSATKTAPEREETPQIRWRRFLLDRRLKKRVEQDGHGGLGAVCRPAGGRFPAYH
jgi:hypothetical protein